MKLIFQKFLLLFYTVFEKTKLFQKIRWFLSSLWKDKIRVVFSFCAEIKRSSPFWILFSLQTFSFFSRFSQRKKREKWKNKKKEPRMINKGKKIFYFNLTNPPLLFFSTKKKGPLLFFSPRGYPPFWFVSKALLYNPLNRFFKKGAVKGTFTIPFPAKEKRFSIIIPQGISFTYFANLRFFKKLSLLEYPPLTNEPKGGVMGLPSYTESVKRCFTITSNGPQGWVSNPLFRKREKVPLHGEVPTACCATSGKVLVKRRFTDRRFFKTKEFNAHQSSFFIKDKKESKLFLKNPFLTPETPGRKYSDSLNEPKGEGKSKKEGYSPFFFFLEEIKKRICYIFYSLLFCFLVCDSHSSELSYLFIRPFSAYLLSGSPSINSLSKIINPLLLPNPPQGRVTLGGLQKNSILQRDDPLPLREDLQKYQIIPPLSEGVTVAPNPVEAGMGSSTLTPPFGPLGKELYVSLEEYLPGEDSVSSTSWSSFFYPVFAGELETSLLCSEKVPIHGTVNRRFTAPPFGSSEESEIFRFVFLHVNGNKNLGTREFISTGFTEWIATFYKICFLISCFFTLPFFIYGSYTFIRPSLWKSHNFFPFRLILFSLFGIFIFYFFISESICLFFLNGEIKGGNGLLNIQIEGRISSYINLFIQIFIFFCLVGWIPLFFLIRAIPSIPIKKLIKNS